MLRFYRVRILKIFKQLHNRQACLVQTGIKSYLHTGKVFYVKLNKSNLCTCEGAGKPEFTTAAEGVRTSKQLVACTTSSPITVGLMQIPSPHLQNQAQIGVPKSHKSNIGGPRYMLNWGQ